MRAPFWMEKCEQFILSFQKEGEEEFSRSVQDSIRRSFGASRAAVTLQPWNNLVMAVINQGPLMSRTP